MRTARWWPSDLPVDSHRDAWGGLGHGDHSYSGEDLGKADTRAGRGCGRPWPTGRRRAARHGTAGRLTARPSAAAVCRRPGRRGPARCRHQGRGGSSGRLRPAVPRPSRCALAHRGLLADPGRARDPPVLRLPRRHWQSGRSDSCVA
jgi:hypothetical protein